MSEAEPYSMKIELNVIRHLGINLYSNIPAVMSELVANAWDANATRVDITIDLDSKIIAIRDNGIGMKRSEVNDRYLTVGYQRRDDITVEPITRKVMGRKGIGKLSVFSIADTIDVFTIKNDERSELRLSLPKINELIKKGEQEYHPEALPEENFPSDLIKGTEIVLRDIRRLLYRTAKPLRQRLARRFSVIGAQCDFDVYIDGVKIVASDRGYFDKLQFVWWYGDAKNKFEQFCTSLVENGQFIRDNTVGIVEGIPPKDLFVSGWIGTVTVPSALKEEEKESVNKIIVRSRGKMVHEDLLESISEGGVYTKYLVGEIDADFLDLDEQEDIATSNRQMIFEEEPRFEALRTFLKNELMVVKNRWTELRNSLATIEAMRIPEIAEWIKELNPDHKKSAEALLGKVNRLPIEDAERSVIFKQAVLAFEILRFQGNLSKIDAWDETTVEQVGSVLNSIEDIESASFYLIFKQRLRLIDQLRDHTDANALEKVIQKHLFDHLWLLDASWNQATSDSVMEERLLKRYKEVDATYDSNDPVLQSRVDIRFKTNGGRNIIVELKRASVRPSTLDLVNQIDKYYRATVDCLKQAGRVEPVSIICLVGKKPLKDIIDETSQRLSDGHLNALNAKVMTYDEICINASNIYSEFLRQQVNANRIHSLFSMIERESDT